MRSDIQVVTKDFSESPLTPSEAQLEPCEVSPIPKQCINPDPKPTPEPRGPHFPFVFSCSMPIRAPNARALFNLLIHRTPPASTTTRAKVKPNGQLPKQHRQHRHFHRSALMASASTSAILYATVVSAADVTGAVPEDSVEKKHHLKGGKGFVNPWESYREQSVWQIGSAMLWLVVAQCFHLIISIHFFRSPSENKSSKHSRIEEP